MIFVTSKGSGSKVRSAREICNNEAHVGNLRKCDSNSEQRKGEGVRLANPRAPCWPDVDDDLTFIKKHPWNDVFNDASAVELWDQNHGSRRGAS